MHILALMQVMLITYGFVRTKTPLCCVHHWGACNGSAILETQHVIDDGLPVHVFLLQKEDPNGSPTSSAHPARFSPDDKFSKQRVVNKKRFGMLLTQQPAPEL
jgi:H/ACA ribonucleoprotein complex subunit 3